MKVNLIMMQFPLLLVAATGLAAAQSVSSDMIHPAKVSAEKVLIVSSRDTVAINGKRVDETLLALPGLQLNDYGGLSGLKTVSFRGLGSSHTSVSIDGLRVVNIQSGQSDLGLIGMADYSEAVVDYATNTVSFNTLRPTCSGWKVNAKGGSFGSFEGHAEHFRILRNDMAMKASISGLSSKGDFPYGDGLFRDGNDISRIQAGFDFFADDLHLKAYCNFSDRGTPGSTTWPSLDRQRDANAFIQGSWAAGITENYKLSAAGKISFDRLAYNTSYGDYLYDQTAAILNVDNDFQINSCLSLQAKLDLEADRMAGDLDGVRASVRPEAALNIDLPKFKASADLMWQMTKDKNNKAICALSPALQLKWLPLAWMDITAFGRRAYRVPTFNELYYAGFGNPDLKPEDAWIADMGLALRRKLCEFALKGGVDLFYNYLTNKIISAPTADNPSIWLPDNIGRASIPGVDISAGAEWTHGDLEIGLKAEYCFMNATDQTVGSYTKGQQLAYVPKHSTTVSADAIWKKTSATLVWNLRSGRRDSYSELPSWNTLDLTLSQGIGKRLRLSVYGRNLTNVRYEVSSGYPMPGISILGGVELCF